MNWSWLSFLIGLLVGWLIELLIDFLFWRRGRRTVQGTQVELQAQLDEQKARVRELEDQLARCQANLRARQEEQQALRAQLAEAQAATSSLQPQQVLQNDRAADAFLPAAEPEDLTRIEGIGPRIAEILNGVGIQKYAQLAGTPASRLGDILREAGPRFRLADPTSWPEQARLAGEGKWEQLRELQNGLSAGHASGETGSAQRPTEEKT
jgi:predicted flap endonuclease-1-like 5' DNA nuclease